MKISKYLIFLSILNITLHAEEILCELKGTYETTYSIPSRNYLQDIGDALKNFTAGPTHRFWLIRQKLIFLINGIKKIFCKPVLEQR